MKLVIGLFIVMQACAPSLEKDWEWDDEGAVEEPEEIDLYRVINATSYEDWVYLDLEENVLLDVEDPENSLDWDIGFMRYHIKLNSGIHGPSTVQGFIVEEEDFASYDEIPQDGYEEDLPDDNEDGIPEYVFADWYDYDPSTHILTPADRFYVIKNRNDRFYKFQIQNYYNGAGTSGHVTIYWEELDPSEEQQ